MQGRLGQLWSVPGEQSRRDLLVNLYFKEIVCKHCLIDEIQGRLGQLWSVPGEQEGTC